MRIAQIAPLAESVPPKLYGGTERVASWLTEELVNLGCDVTLFASGDFSTRAKLVSVCPSLRLSRPAIDPVAASASLLEAVAERAMDFDIIHSHIDWVHLPLLRRLGTPYLTTLHGRLDLPFLNNMARGFSSSPFVSISHNQRTPLPMLNWAANVHHGLPATLLNPVSQPQGYLAFLGRFTPEKGPDIAIKVARAAQMPLKIAAKIPRAEIRYFQQEIEPLIDGNQVEFVGEISDREKASFLGNAAALLFPISWPEPFGLVMIEALACGTPVIAWRCGSVPEIIESEKQGLLSKVKLMPLQRSGNFID